MADARSVLEQLRQQQEPVARQMLEQLRGPAPVPPQRQGFTPQGQFVADPQAVSPGPAPERVTQALTGLATEAAPAAGRMAGSALSLSDRLVAEQLNEQLGFSPETSQMAARVTSDALAIFLVRMPVARGLSRGRTPRRIPARRRSRQTTFQAFEQDFPGVSKGIRRLLRGTGRVAETGLEGAALGVLRDQDPVEIAAFAAGAQGLGSASLNLVQGLSGGGPMRAGAKIGMTAAATGSLIQLLKTATPGGKDFILESMEAGFKKVLAAMALGTAAGVAGFGRMRSATPALAQRFPVAMDALTSLPRGATLSMIRQWRQSEPQRQAEIENALSRLSQPSQFSEREMRQFQDAMRSGNIDRVLKMMRERTGPEFTGAP